MCLSCKDYLFRELELDFFIGHAFSRCLFIISLSFLAFVVSVLIILIKACKRDVVL
jgi:hypothetical protein